MSSLMDVDVNPSVIKEEEEECPSNGIEEKEDEDDEKDLKCPSCGEMCVGAKFLSCLHSLCAECLTKKVKKGEIICPQCGEETEEICSLEELIDDWLKISELEEWNSKNSRLQCHSCVSGDRAVAHCSTCHSYLCSQCSLAHRSMKCFEQHQVRDLNQQPQEEDEDEDEEWKELPQIDEERSNALSTLSDELTSMHEHYDRTKRKIEGIVVEYQSRVKEVGEEYLRLLLQDQREEELRLLAELHQTQKNSQALDDLLLLSQRYRKKKSTLKDQRHKQSQLFKKKLLHFSRVFVSSPRRTTTTTSEHFLHFTCPSVIDFSQMVHQHFGTLKKNNGGEEISSSSGIGSFPPEATLVSNGESNQEEEEEEEDEENSCHEPVVENLRALETIFAGQMSSSVHPNVQRNLEEMLQMSQEHDHQYSLLTRQTSAPPLGQRSPPSSSSTGSHYPPPSLLTTYSSTNSGGSSNGNNSRSTTPFSSSGTLPGCPLDVSVNGLSSSLGVVRRSSGGQSMQVRAKFGSLGPQKCQFNAPHGFCLGIDEEIIVADTNNHRIQIFDKIGEYKYQFGIPGKEEGQLWYPRKVAVIRQSGKFVVCDRGNERSRMQIFTRNGHFIKKISIRYIDIVAGLAITQQGNIVAVDSVSPTVFCISESGDLLKWFDCSDYMREPSDIAIFNNEYFVCDFKGHCVVVFDEDGIFLRRIGSESVTNFPNGIDISDAGDVIIGDSHGNRFHIAVYNRQGDFLQEFDCPYVKVSRCCGLKITSDGFIVTLAKNNHHVLVLNTLYLT